MPRKRFHTLDEEKKSRILGAATKEFSEHGYQGASYNRIIAAAGISKGAMYYYFEDKADLYATVIHEKLWLSMAPHFPAPEDFNPFWEKVEEVLRGAFLGMASDPELFALARGIFDIPMSELAERIEEMQSAQLALVNVVLAEGKRQGVIRDDIPTEMLAQLLFSVMMTLDKITFETANQEVFEDSDDLIALYMDTMKRLAGPQIA